MIGRHINTIIIIIIKPNYRLPCRRPCHDFLVDLCDKNVPHSVGNVTGRESGTGSGSGSGTGSGSGSGSGTGSGSGSGTGSGSGSVKRRRPIDFLAIQER